jgi:hypothetical protein
MRVFARPERPHPGAQLTLFETANGWRYSLWVTAARNPRQQPFVLQYAQFPICSRQTPGRVIRSVPVSDSCVAIRCAGTFEDPGDLGEQIGPPARELAEFGHRGVLLVLG